MYGYHGLMVIESLSLVEAACLMEEGVGVETVIATLDQALSSGPASPFLSVDQVLEGPAFSFMVLIHN